LRIGVVSDTHNHLPNVSRIVALFNAAGVVDLATLECTKLSF